MPSQNQALSLDNPTWEYLHNNFRRTELQKHCREIGITKVYVTKVKLIEMILEKRRQSQVNTEEEEITTKGGINLTSA